MKVDYIDQWRAPGTTGAIIHSIWFIRDFPLMLHKCTFALHFIPEEDSNIFRCLQRWNSVFCVSLEEEWRIDATSLRLPMQYSFLLVFNVFAFVRRIVPKIFSFFVLVTADIRFSVVKGALTKITPVFHFRPPWKLIQIPNVQFGWGIKNGAVKKWRPHNNKLVKLRLLKWHLLDRKSQKIGPAAHAENKHRDKTSINYMGPPNKRERSPLMRFETNWTYSLFSNRLSVRNLTMTSEGVYAFCEVWFLVLPQWSCVTLTTVHAVVLPCIAWRIHQVNKLISPMQGMSGRLQTYLASWCWNTPRFLVKRYVAELTMKFVKSKFSLLHEIFLVTKIHATLTIKNHTKYLTRHRKTS